jgi:hypothetical protein
MSKDPFYNAFAHADDLATQRENMGKARPTAVPLLYVDEFYKDPDRAVVVGHRWFNHGDTAIRTTLEIAKLQRAPDWGAVKQQLRAELNRLMVEEGIDAKAGVADS